MSRFLAPTGWALIEERDDGVACQRGGLRVIISAAIQQDGRVWVHVSASREERVPSWRDMREVRDTFVGDETEAYMVLPPAERYVNLHPHCLHLWVCADGPALPAFDAVVDGVRTI